MKIFNQLSNIIDFLSFTKLLKYYFYTLLLLFSSSSHAGMWDQLWKTSDQKAYQLMQSHQFTAAKRLFKNPAWRATAAYRDGDYAHALHTYQQDLSADGYYNQWNSLVRLGQYKSSEGLWESAFNWTKNGRCAFQCGINSKMAEA